MGVQVGLRSRDGKFRDCSAVAPSSESSRGEPDTDLAVGARSSDDLLLGERGRRVLAQAHRRPGLDDLRTVGPDIEPASRERVLAALTARIAEAGLEPVPGQDPGHLLPVMGGGAGSIRTRRSRSRVRVPAAPSAHQVRGDVHWIQPGGHQGRPEEEKKMSERVWSWQPHLRTDLSEADTARRLATHARLGGGNLR